MSEITARNFDNRSEMSDAAFTAEAVRDEMRHHVGSVVALAPESRKAGLTLAAKILRLPIGRVRSLFYGEARRIDAHEADQVRAYVQAAQELIQARADLERQRDEFIATHPALARLAPPALARTQALAEAEAVVRRASKDRQ